MKGLVFKPEDFQWTSRPIYHGDDADDGAVFGGLKAGNLWRQCDYTVELKNGAYYPQGTHYDNRIYRCGLNSDTAIRPDYSFGEVRSGPYAFKGYFWPNNVYDSDNALMLNGKPIKDDKCTVYFMDSTSFEPKMTTINYAFGRLFFTLFCTFGGLISHGYFKNPIILDIYDQYGNYGIILVDPEVLPLSYTDFSEANGIGSLSFFSLSEYRYQSNDIGGYYYQIRQNIPASGDAAILTIQEGATGNIIVNAGPRSGILTEQYFDYFIKKKDESPQWYPFSYHLKPFSFLDKAISPYSFERCTAIDVTEDLGWVIVPCWAKSTFLLARQDYNIYLALIFFQGNWYLSALNDFYRQPEHWGGPVELYMEWRMVANAKV